jgi:hypothetical protein
MSRGLIVLMIGVSLLAKPALAASVTNGGFETGDFTGWSKAMTCISNPSLPGDWSVYSGTTGPISGRSISAPPEGTFAAVADQLGPSTVVLYQDIALEAASTHSLSFQVYYRNGAAAFATPNSLDCNDAVGPNQQYRIDVLKAATPLDSVAAGDVLATIFQTQTGDPRTLEPTPITFDLTPLAGQTVRLRFAMVANQFFFQGGVDDVQIESTPIKEAPTCNGLEGTIYVKDGAIVGGPDNGKPYDGSLIGTSGDDVMVGTDARDTIEGREGNDTICALEGNDTIAGASGNDTMLGGLGADKLNGASGTDSAPDFNAGESDKRTKVP